MKNYKSGVKFETTNWEFIENLKEVPFCELSSENFDKFVESYKDPLYSFLRFSGYTPEDSEDLVQDLFIKLLETDLLQSVNQENGKLRTYLIGALKRVAYRKHRHKNASKRGGGVDHQSVEETLNLTDSKNTPEEAYDQAWCKSIILRVKDKLFENQPQLTDEQINVLSELLNWNSPDMSYKEAAHILELSVPALKSKVFRLRVLFKELLYQEVASTLTDPTVENVERELEALRSSWEQK